MSSTIEELEEYQSDLISSIKSRTVYEQFNEYALRLYDLQSKSRVYGKLCTGTHSNWEELPYLPITMYKYETIKSFPEHLEGAVNFRSSGTTQSERSSHHMYSTELYRRVSRQGYFDYIHDGNELSTVYGLSAKLDSRSSSLLSMMLSVVSGVGMLS